MTLNGPSQIPDSAPETPHAVVVPHSDEVQRLFVELLDCCWEGVFEEGGLARVPGSIPVGESLDFNTCVAREQFLLVMSLGVRGRPEINSWLDAGELPLADFHQEQILSGFNILDLGCGVPPAFVHTCKLFGATCYTADFIELKSGMHPVIDDVTIAQHIVGDLRCDETWSDIRESVGDMHFDLITADRRNHPYYESMSPPLPSELVRRVSPMLKIGGQLVFAGGDELELIRRTY